MQLALGYFSKGC